MKKIAIYGKGGIGKSTTTSNLSAGLSSLGFTVMQIGCDPKSDSVKNLMGGKKIPTVLDLLREQSAKNAGVSKWEGATSEGITLDDIVFKGYGGVLCVEAGGPTPGLGCAGRGIITAFEKLEELGAYDFYKPDIVLYDVLGDVVCGGFAMPIRNGYADNVFVVTSGEMMALYAASNIVSAVKNFGSRGYASYAGVILNSRNVKDEVAVVETALKEIGGSIVSVIPRSDTVQLAENQGKTVVEAYPESEQAQCYVELAKKVMQICEVQK
ncbi:MAG: AAA family ATPase [Treponema sp.]|nr:AAA family ATPase [Treponema sp.]